MKRWVYFAKILLVFGVVAAACFFLKRELSKYTWADFRASLDAVTGAQIALAALLTFINYVVLFGYDWIAIRYIGHRLPVRRLAVASFIGQSASLNFGSLLGGAAARLRMYTLLGFHPMEVLELIAILGITYWLGALSLAATVFFISPPEIPADWAKLFTTVHMVDALGVTLMFGIVIYVVLAIVYREFPPPLRSRRAAILAAVTGLGAGAFGVARMLPDAARQPLRNAGSLGFLLAAIVIVYLFIVTFRREPIPMFGHRLRLPPLRVSLTQIVVAAADFVVGATAFYVLLPKGTQVPYMAFLGIYLLGQVVSAFTHAPGGLGILELIVLKFVDEGSSVLAPVLLFRVIYFWLPLALAGGLLFGAEFGWRRHPRKGETS